MSDRHGENDEALVGLEPLEPRLRGYLHARGAVDVPPEFAAQALEGVRSDGPRPWFFARRWTAVAGIAALLVLAAITFAPGSRPNVPVDESLRPSDAAQASPTATELDDEFPDSVLGMPVLSVGDANALLVEGRIYGRAVAVKGYWIHAMLHSCPRPGRFQNPLEERCIRQDFSSIGYRGFTCTESSDGSGLLCHSNVAPVGARTLEPLMLIETGAKEALWRNFNEDSYPDGIPSVLIVHVGDPRAWQCPSELRDECRRQFVVDRVAWTAGAGSSLTMPDTEVRPELSIAELEIIIGEASLISAQPMLASDAPAVDPRFQASGDDILWIARSLRDTLVNDPTRALDVWLVDDETASARSIGLEQPADYQPGEFRAQAAERVGPIDHHLIPFFRVELPDGTPVQDLFVSSYSSSRGDSVSEQHAGLPALLEPGTYVVRAWRTAYVNRFVSEHPDECVTEFDIAALEVVRLEAAFPVTGACSWREPTFEDSLF
ncbi:MAG: hypothetical protein WD830_10130 [Chloroflexota bacterium]